MSNALTLAAILGPTYLIFGFSLLLYAKSWRQLMEKYEKDHFLLFPDLFFSLIFGLVMINMYNVWEWNLSLLITLTGWSLFLKGGFYFLAPAKWITAVLRIKEKLYFQFGAVIAIVIGAALSYLAFVK